MRKIRNACKDERERSIVELLLSTGIRVSELKDLNIEDLDFDTNVIEVKHGKGDKSRVTFMSNIAMYHVNEYLKARNDNLEALFLYRDRRLNPGGVRAILKSIEDRCGVKNIHPHRFRHTFATTLNAKGMPVEHIQQLLGHSKLDTTMIYVKVDKNQIKHEYEKMFCL